MPDPIYTLVVQISGCEARPNPVEDEVRNVLELCGYECHVSVSLPYFIRDLQERVGDI